MSWIKNNEWLKNDRERNVRWGSLLRFAENYRPFQRSLLFAGALTLVASAAAFAVPLIFRTLQSAISARDASLVAVALGAFLAFSLLEVGTSYVIRRVSAHVSTRLDRDLVLTYYKKLLNLAVEDFVDFKRRSNLFQRIIDAMSITTQCTDTLIRGSQKVIVAVVIAAVIGTLSLPVLGVLVVGSALLFWYALEMAHRLAERRRETLAVNYPLVGKMTEVIGGLFTIKALAASVQVTSDVDRLVDRKSRAKFDEQLTQVRSDQVAQALRAVTLVAAIGTSFVFLLRGTLPLADVFALYVLANLMLAPVLELAVLYQAMARLSGNVEAYYEVLDLPDETEAVRRRLAEEAESIADEADLQPANDDAVDDRVEEAARPAARSLSPPTPRTVGALALADEPEQRDDAVERVATRPSLVRAPALAAEGAGRVAFEGLSFAYRDGTEVIRDLDLEIEPGERVSLIGKSGAGKTTLMRLLLGFLQPQKGRILVDGEDVTRILDPHAHRRRFGVVSQQDFLFATSLRENLSFGLDEDVPAERMEEALRLVDLWDEVSRLDDGLESTYSADLFSGGQKQRFFIARALLRQPSIVLLDEPTSALDFESERRVMEAIDELVGGKTTLTIAHRLSTVQNADRVVVLREGRVEASGTHDALYGSNEYYRSLCDFNSFVVS